jgi:hypothetical protein
VLGKQIELFPRRCSLSIPIVAGEIVLPAKKGKEPIQFNRTPFVVAFQAGWFKFNICTVHIYYGSAQDTGPRKREIALIPRCRRAFGFDMGADQPARAD